MSDVRRIKIKPKKPFFKSLRSKNFFQKSFGSFEPNSYEGETFEERRNLAHQHAKQHENFYKDLVKNGVYPEGTKIKVKRKKHSSAYTVELFMPKIKPLNDSLFGGARESEIPSITEKIIETAHKHGYDEATYSGRGPAYHDDIFIQDDMFKEHLSNPPKHHLRNYGIDSKGKIRYLDAHTLMVHLPLSKKRAVWKRK